MPVYTVVVTDVQHVPHLGVDRQMHMLTRVGITVGGRGPFYKEFPPPYDTPIQINQWKQQMVDNLRAIDGN